MANINSKKLNLLQQYKAKQEEQKKANAKEKNLTSIMCVVGAAILVVCLGLYFLLNMVRSDKLALVDDAKAELANQDLITKNTLAADVLAANVEIEGIIAAVEKAKENMTAASDQSHLKETLMTDIKSVLGKDTEIVSIEYSQKLLSISLKTKTANKVSAFVAALEEKEIFKSISYTGFNGDSEDTAAGFTYQIVCAF